MIQFLWGFHLELLPADFHAFEGGGGADVGALTGLMVLAKGLIDQTVIYSCLRLR